MPIKFGKKAEYVDKFKAAEEASLDAIEAAKLLLKVPAFVKLLIENPASVTSVLF